MGGVERGPVGPRVKREDVNQKGDERIRSPDYNAP
jgi:hypothetical protein